MSVPSEKYLKKIESWILGGLPIQRMSMSTEQKYRARVAYEGYQMWLQDRQIRPADLMRRISQRDYAVLLQRAKEGDEEAQQYVTDLQIQEGVPRGMSQISNDVYVLNWIISRFNVDTSAIEKAKVQDASDWLIREGMKMGDARAVKSGADIKMALNRNFDEKQNLEEQLPDHNINITGDVSVVKSDRVNYTDEEKRRMAKKFGLSMAEVEEYIQNEDGIYESAKEEEEIMPDVFEVE